MNRDDILALHVHQQSLNWRALLLWVLIVVALGAIVLS
jgi:hypothetical protein